MCQRRASHCIDMSTTTTHRRPCSSQAQDAAAAVGWARSVLSDPNTVILDTETTDLPGRIIQISAIDVTGQMVLNTLVNPQCPISPAATAVHGLRTADLRDAPTLQQIWATLLTMLAGRHLLAYNAPYDRHVLELEATRLRVPVLSARWSCVMRARAIADGTGRYTALGGPHDALGDCRATLAVLHQISSTFTNN